MADYEKSISTQVAWTLAVLFAVFIIANGILHSLAVLVGLTGRIPRSVLFSEESALAARLLVWAIGLGISFYLARVLYQFLLKRDITVSESSNLVYVLLLYLVLGASTISFLGAISWFWLPLLFLLLLIYTIFSLWSLIGGWATLATVGISLLVIAVVVLLVA